MSAVGQSMRMIITSQPQRGGGTEASDSVDWPASPYFMAGEISATNPPSTAKWICSRLADDTESALVSR